MKSHKNYPQNVIQYDSYMQRSLSRTFIYWANEIIMIQSDNTVLNL